MGYYLGVTIKFLEEMMLLMIYDIVWWGLFVISGVISLLLTYAYFDSEKGVWLQALTNQVYILGINLVVFVMMFLSIDKQLLI
jgi:hypothetical protein